MLVEISQTSLRDCLTNSILPQHMFKGNPIWFQMCVWRHSVVCRYTYFENRDVLISVCLWEIYLFDLCPPWCSGVFVWRRDRRLHDVFGGSGLHRGVRVTPHSPGNNQFSVNLKVILHESTLFVLLFFRTNVCRHWRIQGGSTFCLKIHIIWEIQTTNTESFGSFQNPFFSK